MYLELMIKKLEKRIEKLEKNSIPNQELKNSKNRLVNRTKKGAFPYYDLDEGNTKLTFPKIFEMLHEVSDKGNFYILLCGAKCSTDVAMFDFNRGEKDSDEILNDLYIKKIFDNRIDKDKCYLIALDKIGQENIPDENIAMFERK